MVVYANCALGMALCFLRYTRIRSEIWEGLFLSWNSEIHTLIYVYII